MKYFTAYELRVFVTDSNVLETKFTGMYNKILTLKDYVCVSMSFIIRLSHGLRNVFFQSIRRLPSSPPLPYNSITRSWFHFLHAIPIPSQLFLYPETTYYPFPTYAAYSLLLPNVSATSSA